MVKASIGCVNCFVINGDTIYFGENINKTHAKIDCRNMASIKYLNMRHSTISDIET